MPTSAPGSDLPGDARESVARLTAVPRGSHHRLALPDRRRQAGFTLLELLIVVAIIALASSVVSLALPDPATARLEREATRLANLLEGGRAQARAMGLVVGWVPAAPPSPAAARDAGAPADDFHFAGLPPGADLPTRWLEPNRADEPGAGIQVQLVPQRPQVLLGPEPVIEAQRILLSLGDRRLSIATDGLAPFAVQAASDAAP